MVSAPTDLHSDEGEVRARNRRTVDRFMEETVGAARLRRHLLFAEDAVAGLVTTDTGVPMMVTGRDRIERLSAWSMEAMPDWSWSEVEVHETRDPEVFWVECDGRGHLNFPAYGSRWYENHFIQFFRVRDGLIVEQREFMNPVRQLQALGLDVPAVDRGAAVPADYDGRAAGSAS